MADATCIIQTPRNSDPQGLAPSITLAKCRQIPVDDAVLLLEVGHFDAAGPRAREGNVLSFYTHEGYVCMRVGALEALLPIARGEVRKGRYVYTIDRDYAKDAGKDDAESVNTALRWLEHTRFISGGEALVALKSPPYLLITSRRRQLAGGKHCHELLLTLEMHPSELSVKGAVLERWPIWDYEFALADLMGRAEVIREQLEATGNESHIEVDAHDLIQWVRFDLTAPGMEILRQAHRDTFKSGA